MKPNIYPPATPQHELSSHDSCEPVELQTTPLPSSDIAPETLPQVTTPELLIAAGSAALDDTINSEIQSAQSEHAVQPASPEQHQLLIAEHQASILGRFKAPKHAEALSLIVEGFSRQEIAGMLDIPKATVKHFANRTHRALGTSNVVQLTALFNNPFYKPVPMERTRDDF